MTKHIALDFDETLYPMLNQLDKFHRRTRKTPIRTKITEYNYAQRYNMSTQASKFFVREFYQSTEHALCDPIYKAKDTMRALKKKGYILGIITGRQYYASGVTYEYVKKHFDGIFDYMEFTNSFSLYGREKSKIDVCKKHNVTVIIDDSLEVCKQAHNNSIHSILFGNYPWNAQPDVPDVSLARILSWCELQI